MSSLRGLGRKAEDAAAKFLLERGFTIVTRRYKARHGEIDLVALDGEVLVFVEVKMRRAAGYSPEEAVGEGKIEHLSSAARQYCVEMEQEGRDIRFDVVAIDGDGMRHYVDAFKPA